MSILDRLNSGELHAAARATRPDCVDATGNIHKTPERARFVDWRAEQVAAHGRDVEAWPAKKRAEYARRYVPAAG